MKRKDIGYCLMTPVGDILADTMAETEEDVKFDAYRVHSVIDRQWGMDFWKKYPASWKSLAKKGYSVVRVRCVECDENGIPDDWETR